MRTSRWTFVVVPAVMLAALAPPVTAQAAVDCADATWMNTALPAQRRADLLLAQMTLAEKVSMTHAVSDNDHARETLSIARLCVPALRLNNGPAGVGSSGPIQAQSTALPAPLGLAATFDPKVARAYGAVEGRETRDTGRNLMEGPDINIARTPRSTGARSRRTAKTPSSPGIYRPQTSKASSRRASSPTLSTTWPTTRKSTGTRSTSSSTSAPCARSICRPSRRRSNRAAPAR